MNVNKHSRLVYHRHSVNLTRISSYRVFVCVKKVTSGRIPGFMKWFGRIPGFVQFWVFETPALLLLK